MIGVVGSDHGSCFKRSATLPLVSEMPFPAGFEKRRSGLHDEGRVACKGKRRFGVHSSFSDVQGGPAGDVMQEGGHL
jgi:hypothetical protein